MIGALGLTFPGLHWRLEDFARFNRYAEWLQNSKRTTSPLMNTAMFGSCASLSSSWPPCGHATDSHDKALKAKLASLVERLAQLLVKIEEFPTNAVGAKTLTAVKQQESLALRLEALCGKLCSLSDAQQRDVKHEARDYNRYQMQELSHLCVMQQNTINWQGCLLANWQSWWDNTDCGGTVAPDLSKLAELLVNPVVELSANYQTDPEIQKNLSEEDEAWVHVPRPSNSRSKGGVVSC